MPRLSIEELKAKLLVDFPNNIAGLITPTIVRNYFTAFLDAIRPAYGGISRPGPVVQALITTDTPIVFDSSFVNGVPDFTPNAATGSILRLERGTTRLTFSATAEGAINRLVNFSIYRNGSITPWRASVALLGAGKPVDVSINAIDYFGAAADFQLRARIDTDASVTFSSMDMLAETVPVNTYD